MKHYVNSVFFSRLIGKIEHLFAHIKQHRTVGILLVFKSILTRLNLIHYFQQSITLIIKKMNSMELIVQ